MLVIFVQSAELADPEGELTFGKAVNVDFQVQCETISGSQVCSKMSRQLTISATSDLRPYVVAWSADKP